MKDKYNSLGFIWDILHERGQGIASENSTESERYSIEQNAWDFAEEEIKKKYPLLEEMMDDFYKHRDTCLKSYL